MTRDELDREVEYADLLDKLAAAKKGRNRDRLAEAKEAVFAFREKQRNEASPGLAKPGQAKPASLKVKAKGN